MSTESLGQFLTKVEGNEELQFACRHAMSTSELITLGAEYGCKFSIEDLEAADDLSEKELNQITGGIGQQSALSFLSLGERGWVIEIKE